jgi:polyhydroxyalkanoate synthesis regulator phasin
MEATRKMMKRKALVIGAIVAALGLGAGALAVQAAPSATTSTDYRQVFVDKLAGILHKSSKETADGIKKASEQTVDQMVKDGKITQAQADKMKQAIASGKGFGFGGERSERGERHGDSALKQDLRTAKINAMAKLFGLTPADLQAQLKAGKSIKDLQQAKGVSDEALKAARHQAVKPVLDQAVKDGKLTQAQADQMLQRIDSGGGGHHFDSRRLPPPGNPTT